MHYLKYFEELSFKPDYEPHWSKEIVGDDTTPYKEIRYSFEIDNVEFIVTFGKDNQLIKRLNMDEIYDREYRSKNGGFDLVGIGANKVIAVITAITYDFINNFKPNCIVIHHINISGEDSSFSKLNKRARINYQFIKSIDSDYKLNYYGIKINKESPKSVGTLCLISKKDFDIQPLVDSYDRNIDYQRHVPINIL